MSPRKAVGSRRQTLIIILASVLAIVGVFGAVFVNSGAANAGGTAKLSAAVKGNEIVVTGTGFTKSTSASAVEVITSIALDGKTEAVTKSSFVDTTGQFSVSFPVDATFKGAVGISSRTLLDAATASYIVQ